MAYTPTVWVNGVAPAIDATNLNHMETQYTQALADIPEDAAAGTPSERTLGTGALQAAAGDHTHPLQEIAQNFADEGDSGELTGAYSGLSVDITSTYGATGRRRVTFTPATALAAVVVTMITHHSNGSNGVAATYSDRILVGGAQKKEITQVVAGGDGTAAGSKHNANATAWTEIDGPAASTNYDTEHKESANTVNHSINGYANALAVVEISV